MEFFSNKRKGLFFLGVFLLTVAGTYNAVVINGDSGIQGEDIRFAKRLDEVYGIVTPGRHIAAAKTWKKLPKQISIHSVEKQRPSTQESPKIAAPVTASIQDELNLNLQAVDHPKKWAKGLPQGEFSGNLQTADGIIENLSVSLPGGDSISVSFVEMSGNVFEYDLSGEVLSGIIYQVDQSTYMVTLSNGPFEGTRLRFTGANEAETEATEAVALNEQEFQTVSFHF